MTRKKMRLEDVWGMVESKKQTGRFREILSLRSIEDTETGKQYRGVLDDDFLELINNINGENKKIKNILKDKIKQLNHDYDYYASKGASTSSIIAELDVLEDIAEQMSWKEEIGE